MCFPVLHREVLFFRRGLLAIVETMEFVTRMLANLTDTSAMTNAKWADSRMISLLFFSVSCQHTHHDTFSKSQAPEPQRAGQGEAVASTGQGGTTPMKRKSILKKHETKAAATASTSSSRGRSSKVSDCRKQRCDPMTTASSSSSMAEGLGYRYTKKGDRYLTIPAPVPGRPKRRLVLVMKEPKTHSPSSRTTPKEKNLKTSPLLSESLFVARSAWLLFWLLYLHNRVIVRTLLWITYKSMRLTRWLMACFFLEPRRGHHALTRPAARAGAR